MIYLNPRFDFPICPTQAADVRQVLPISCSWCECWLLCCCYVRVWEALPSAVRFRGRGHHSEKNLPANAHENISDQPKRTSPATAVRPSVPPLLSGRVARRCLGLFRFRSGLAPRSTGTRAVAFEEFHESAPPLLPESWTALHSCIRRIHSFPSMVVGCEPTEERLRFLRRSHKSSKAGVTALGRLL